MKALAAALAVVLLSLSLPIGFAQAHTVIDGIGGFTGGLLHPLLVPAHILALVALGCLTGRSDWQLRLLLIAVFAAAAGATIALVTFAFSSANAELTILSLAGLAGLLLVSGVRIPSAAVAVLAVCIAAAVIFDSVPAVLSAQETILSLAGTGLGATSLLAAITFLSAAGPQVWQRIGTRILGSWIAASAIMVLALRLAG